MTATLPRSPETETAEAVAAAKAASEAETAKSVALQGELDTATKTLASERTAQAEALRTRAAGLVRSAEGVKAKVAHGSSQSSLTRLRHTWALLLQYLRLRATRLKIRCRGGVARRTRGGIGRAS